MNKIFRKVMLFPRKIGIFLINFYQKYISGSFGRKCIYYPSCSEYAKQAVDKYGIIKGSVLALLRILRCNPFAKGGVDKLK